jgi:hypothetical protein
MMGYSVTEAASVLGVPTERVWELLARGVLSGEPEGETGMRVYLQPRAAPSPVAQTEDPITARSNGPERELSPFRELLSEFRSLTERYGQALLALGEARGEVASLRSRVDLLEARIDLRLPMSPTAATAWPTQSLPVSESTAEPPAEAAAEHEDEEAHRRRRRGARRATQGFAQALARAEDPSLADLAGSTDADALAAFRSEAEVAEAEIAAADAAEVDRGLPREVLPAEPMLVEDEAVEPEPVSDEVELVDAWAEPVDALAAPVDIGPAPVDVEPEAGEPETTDVEPVSAEPEPVDIQPVTSEPEPVGVEAELAEMAEAEPVDVEAEVAEPVDVEHEAAEPVDVEPSAWEEPALAPDATEDALLATLPATEPEPWPEFESVVEPVSDIGDESVDAEPEPGPPAPGAASGREARTDAPAAQRLEAEAESADFDAERYTSVIEQPDWFEAEADPWPATEPGDETTADLAESAAPAQPSATEATDAPEALGGEMALDEQDDEPTEADADEPVDRGGSELREGGADEMEVAGGGQGVAPIEPEVPPNTDLPGSRELDEALDEFGDLEKRSVPATADDEWPPAASGWDRSPPTARSSGSVTGLQRSTYGSQLPQSSATRAYRRLRRIFPT